MEQQPDFQEPLLPGYFLLGMLFDLFRSLCPSFAKTQMLDSGQTDILIAAAQVLT